MTDRLISQSPRGRTADSPWASLDRGLAPRAVAIYGASSSAHGLGGGFAATIARKMADHDYAGRLALVNPRLQMVLGQQTIASAVSSDLAEFLDFAVIAVPAPAVNSAIEDCAAAGIPLATIVSAGFAEMDENGAELEANLLSLARETGIRFFGPNCLGLINFTHGLFASTQFVPEAKPGPISIVGQSGSIATSLLEQISLAGIGTDLWLTIGNASDISPAECVEYLAHRESTKVIVLYLETLGDPDQFRTALLAARTIGKEIVILKSGRSIIGARATASHTASAGSPDVFVDVLVRECDAIRVFSVREASIAVSVLSATGRLKGRAAIITTSGGAAALAADACHEVGLALASLSAETVAHVKGLVPQSGVTNPVDPTSLAFGKGCMDQILRAIAEDPQVDYLIYLGGDNIRYFGAALKDALIPLATQLPVLIDGEVPDDLRTDFVAAGIALTDDIECLWRSLARLTEAEVSAGAADINSGVGRFLSEDDQLLSEFDALDSLAKAGLPMVRTSVVTSEADVRSAMEVLGRPVVLKGIVPGLAHKSQHSLVRLDIFSEEDGIVGFRSLSQLLQSYPNSFIIVQPQVRNGLAEVIIGSINDDQFGVHVMVGAGGIWTELGSNRVWERAPIDYEKATEMVGRLALGRGLASDQRGVRANAAKLADAILRLSHWALEHSSEVSDVEINPIIVCDDDIVGVDALIRRSQRIDDTSLA